MLVALTGVGAWWYQSEKAGSLQRQANAEGRVKVSLRDSKELALRAVQLGDQPEEWDHVLSLARATAEQAQKLVDSNDVSDSLHQELQQLQMELADANRLHSLLVTLEEIHLQLVEAPSMRLDGKTMARRFSQAFNAYGLAILDADPAEIAERIQQSSQRERLRAALAFWEAKTPDASERRRLARLLTLIDPDANSLDNRWRSAIESGETPAIQNVIKETIDQRQRPEKILYLAIACCDHGKFYEALDLLRFGTQQYPSDFWMHFELAALLFAHEKRTPQQLDEGLRHSLAALAIRPHSEPAQLNLAVALNIKGLKAEAAFAYQRALEEHPRSARTHTFIGEARVAEKRLDEAVSSYRTAIECDPKFGLAWNGLGVIQRGRGAIDDAIVSLKKAAECAPELAEIQFNLGIALMMKGQKEEAVLAFKRAIEIKPNYTKAHNNLGIVFAQQGSNNEAFASYSKALEWDPNFADANYNIAIIHVMRGNLEEGIRHYQKAIDASPKLATAHLRLGMVYQRQERLDDALLCFKKAVALEPANPTAQYNLGNILLLKNRWNEALQCFEKTVAANPKHVEGYHKLGLALAKQNRFDDAIVNYKKSLALKPNNAPVYLNLGVAYSKQDRQDDAIAAFRKAIEIDEDLPEPHLNLGRKLAEQGKHEEAAASLKRGIALLKPEDPKLAEYQQLLNDLDKK